ncbi:MAG: hypothetical protein D6729_11375 [Deltaproteobacteria bacterium]|nr:MAG: hypothetical protein D6729_11375 [Deltaproteobacteria bacterium]
MGEERLGRYRMGRRIAVGGMAEIFLGRMEGAAGFQKEVVLKRILPHLAEDREFVEMFRDEARLAARLSHVNIAQVFDFDEEDGVLFLAMEYVHGKDLRRVQVAARDAGLRITPMRATHIAREVARGLAHAHGLRADDGTPLGIVHRDISPQNILVSFAGEVKITDFGIAKAAQRSSVTAEGIIKGKSGYMSPEQAAGRTVDARTDVFALGIVLWELLTGRALFTGATDIEILHAVQSRAVPPPSSIHPDVPAELDAVVLRALERDPAARFPTAAEMESALADVLLSHAATSKELDLASMMRALFPEEANGLRRRTQRLDAAPLPSVPGSSLPEAGDGHTAATRAERGRSAGAGVAHGPAGAAVVWKDSSGNPPSEDPRARATAPLPGPRRPERVLRHWGLGAAVVGALLGLVLLAWPLRAPRGRPSVDAAAEGTPKNAVPDTAGASPIGAAARPSAEETSHAARTGPAATATAKQEPTPASVPGPETEAPEPPARAAAAEPSTPSPAATGGQEAGDRPPPGTRRGRRARGRQMRSTAARRPHSEPRASAREGGTRMLSGGERAAPAPARPRPVVLPVGTRLQVRLDLGVDTLAATAARATVTRSLVVSGRVVVPRGSRLFGTVQGHAGRVLLRFDRLQLAGGEVLQIDAVAYDGDGRPGIRAAEALTGETALTLPAGKRFGVRLQKSLAVG